MPAPRHKPFSLKPQEYVSYSASGGSEVHGQDTDAVPTNAEVQEGEYLSS